MTFEDWWEKNKPKTFSIGQLSAAKAAWIAATAAERQRCREIALNVGEEGLSDLWFTCADKIADEIGE